MIKQLVEGNETVVRTARELMPVVEKAEDEVTLNMLAEIGRAHV